MTSAVLCFTVNYYLTVLMDPSMFNPSREDEDKKLLQRTFRVMLYGSSLFLLVLPVSYWRGTALLSGNVTLAVVTLAILLLLVVIPVIYTVYKSVVNVLTLRRLLRDSESIVTHDIEGKNHRIQLIQNHVTKVSSHVVASIGACLVIVASLFVTYAIKLSPGYWSPICNLLSYIVARGCFSFVIYKSMHLIVYDDFSWEDVRSYLSRMCCSWKVTSRGPRAHDEERADKVHKQVTVSPISIYRSTKRTSPVSEREDGIDASTELVQLSRIPTP